VPYVLGAISVFHSVPGVESGSGGLNMTGCLLSQIFRRDITTWDHPSILRFNPGLQGVPAGTPISVVRRVHGSSSTASFTEYLHVACPSEWPAELVGKTVDWPEGTVAAQGSDGVSDALDAAPYSIGYIDAGHGHRLGLKEIELQNADGRYIDSKRANVGAAAARALAQGLLPSSLDQSCHRVKLLNMPGPDTWPIVAMSYFYLDRDLTALGDSGPLLKAFVEYVLSPEVQGTADSEGKIAQFGFSPVPPEVMALNRQALDSLQTAGQAWTFESADETIKGGGALEYVFSGKRQAYGAYQRENLALQIKGLAGRLDGVQAESGRPADAQPASQVSLPASSDDDGDGGDRALVLAALSLSVVSLVVALASCGALLHMRSKVKHLRASDTESLATKV